jgi:myo-inositol catabolism protein IolS
LKRVELGKSGLKVSPIGIGTYQATAFWGATDQGVVDAIRTSHEMSVNFIDTAEEYGHGHSEEVVRTATKGIPRDELVIATKVYGSHLRFEEMQKACSASSRRLGVREIDLFQVHWPDPWEQIPLKYTMKAMEKLKAEGKIRAIGVSNFAVRDLEEAASLLPRSEIASNQVRYNLLQREIEEEVLPYCQKNGITVLPWGPLAQGLLGGKYSRRKLPSSKARRASPLYSDHNLAEVGKLVQVLRRVAKKHRKTVAQVAINWLARGGRTVPIVGATSSEQAMQNAQAADWELAPRELVEIGRASDRVRLDYFV